MKRYFKFLVILVLCVLCALCGLNYADTAMMNAFNSGEVTEELGGRSDVRKYYSACRTMENLYCQSQGGASKRPGTYYISQAPGESRLVPFDRAVGDGVIMEFSNETIRFYK